MLYIYTLHIGFLLARSSPLHVTESGRHSQTRHTDAHAKQQSGGIAGLPGAATSSPPRPVSRTQRDRQVDGHQGSSREAWNASLDNGGERKRWAQPRGTSSDESADEEAAALLRESRFRARMQSGQGSARGTKDPSRGGRGRRSASPTLRRPVASESDDLDPMENEPIRRPSSAMRERPRPASSHRQPLRASYDAGRGGSSSSAGFAHAQMYKGGAVRGLDRAVERELTQLKRMFGL